MSMEKRLKIAILVLMISILVSGISAQFPRKGDFPVVLINCYQFFEEIRTPKIPPSQACCETLRAYDIPCLCKKFPPFLDLLISMEEFMYVATTCGCQIPPPGDKSGSYTIPAPAPPPPPPPAPGALFQPPLKA